MDDKKCLEVFDFVSGNIIEESIPAEGILRTLYEGDTLSSKSAKYLIAKVPFFSKAFGFWMKMPWTKKGISPFIKKYGVKLEDFEDKKYKSFNDFFIRRLKSEARPLCSDAIICPCDGRHLFYQDLSKKNSFYIKGKSFSIEELLKDKELADQYSEGSMIISRLAPADYHRFHFPSDGAIEDIKRINGSLYSVSPVALRTNPGLIIENKRILTKIASKNHGQIIQVLVGATNVGSIHVTAKHGTQYSKGDELGFFSFGGSMVITLFKKDKVRFAEELTSMTENNIEVLMKIGSRFLHEN